MRMPPTAATIALALALCLPAGAVPPAAAVPGKGDPVVLDDFAAPEPGPGWHADSLEIRRVEGADGGALELSGWKIPKDGEAVAALDLAVRDWRGFEALAFGITADRGPLTMDVIVRRGSGVRMRCARVEFGGGAREERRLLLRDFMDEGWGLHADFSEVDRLDFRFARASGTVRLDHLRLLPGDRGEKSHLRSTEEWLALGFPDGKGRAVPGKTFVLLTDSPEYQGTRGRKILSHLEDAVKLLEGRYGVKGDLPDREPFFLFGSVAAYGGFYSRLHERTFGNPRTVSGPTGFAIGGAGAAALQPGEPPYEPLLVHDALHPVVRDRLGLGTSGNWVQEGLVCAVQNRFHPEYFRDSSSHFRLATRASFLALLKGESGNLLPLAELAGAEGARTEDMTEAMTVFDYLADRHRGKLGAVWDAVRALDEPPREAALRAIAGAVGMEVDALQEDWAKWGAASFK